ncbi:MAG TPA: UrcA family protein [Steroidobacteraceae bacterium]|nr:UrcA family protein [Steroidobacteraceae bacterium]
MPDLTKSSRYTWRGAAVAVLVGGCTLAGSSMAAEPQVIKIQLQYSPAEVGSADGAARLYRRIQFAARQACGEADSREVVRYFLAKKCFERAVDDAVAKVDAPALTAVHRNHPLRTEAG